MTPESSGPYRMIDLAPWQLDVLERITNPNVERVALNVPHRQGRSAAYDVVERTAP